MSIQTNETGSYYSSVNFLIPQSPPADLSTELQSALSQIYLCLQQVIQCFVNNCGISSQSPSQWSSFAGNGNTILRSNLGRFYVTAAERIAYGAAINIFALNGTTYVRNANATDNTKSCMGFCDTAGGIVANSVGEVIIGSGLVSLSGLTVGTSYYLATVGGYITSGRPSSSGNIEQYVGFAISQTQLYFNVGGYVQH